MEWDGLEPYIGIPSGGWPPFTIMSGIAWAQTLELWEQQLVSKISHIREYALSALGQHAQAQYETVMMRLAATELGAPEELGFESRLTGHDDRLDWCVAKPANLLARPG